jgi:Arc/MetJ family transcription regulator
MRKTTISVDDDLVARAGEALGTRGITETIDRALREAVARAARRDLVDWLQGLDPDEVDQHRAAAWQR